MPEGCTRREDARRHTGVDTRTQTHGRTNTRTHSHRHTDTWTHGHTETHSHRHTGTHGGCSCRWGMGLLALILVGSPGWERQGSPPQPGAGEGSRWRVGTCLSARVGVPGDEVARASPPCPACPSLSGTVGGRAPSWVVPQLEERGRRALGSRTLLVLPGEGGQPGKPAPEEGSSWSLRAGPRWVGAQQDPTLGWAGGSPVAGWVGEGSSTGSPQPCCGTRELCTPWRWHWVPCRAP